MIEYVKNTYCSYCGAVFTMATWPRHCVICDNTTWQNPLPVVVVMARVCPNLNSYSSSYILIRRSIPPQVGELAFPGGYLDMGETWREGAARELREETGTSVSPERIQFHEMITSPVSSNLVIFCKVDVDWDEVNFVPNDEVSGLYLAFNPTELAFPSHTEQLKRALNG